MVRQRCCIGTLLMIGAMVIPTFAKVGIGFHWGNDFTLRMEDVDQEWLSFDDLSIDNMAGISGTLPSEISSAITGKDLPIYISRETWERKLVNGGLKIYVDIIPILDAVEVSSNFGLWQYEGSVSYPVSLSVKDNVDYASVKEPTDIFQIDSMATIPLTLKNYGAGIGGFDGTPYMKLQFDLTIRKYIFQLPKTLKTLRLYGGAGVSLHFATPVLNKELIQDAIGETIESAGSLTDLAFFSQDKVIESIVKEILANMMTPHFGMHIDLGIMVKIPVVPLGFYVDGKFLIPFDDMDGLEGWGMLLNSGISLSF